MKKIIPYIISLGLGCICGLLLFNSSIKFSFLKQELKATGFQLGVYKTRELAKEMTEKYPSSIIIQDDDVFRVYYSILSDQNIINKMENYLLKEKIAYYKKDLTLSDKGLINALNKYENAMNNVSDITFSSLNLLIMDSYGDEL